MTMSCLCLSVVGNHFVIASAKPQITSSYFSPPWAGAHHRYVALQSLHSIQSTQIIYRKIPSVEVSRCTIIVSGVLIIISCWHVGSPRVPPPPLHFRRGAGWTFLSSFVLLRIPTSGLLSNSFLFSSISSSAKNRLALDRHQTLYTLYNNDGCYHHRRRWLPWPMPLHVAAWGSQDMSR